MAWTVDAMIQHEDPNSALSGAASDESSEEILGPAGFAPSDGAPPSALCDVPPGDTDDESKLDVPSINAASTADEKLDSSTCAHLA